MTQKSKHGLIIPEKAQAKANEATVVAIGEGARDKVRVCHNNIIPPAFVSIERGREKGASGGWREGRRGRGGPVEEVTILL